MGFELNLAMKTKRIHKQFQRLRLEKIGTNAENWNQ